ncbi:E3 ubiquitin-protein ligase XIAP-like isoform X2 [Clavelina lepadiformis]|uniref:E3 ubiquitin-protein ligase XIAP-like isoform X2 n=1 Tax=Clavelina lepadiformis TaxID=159417 RepID=UPI0040412BB2
MARTFKVKICRSVSIQIAMINFHNVLLYIFARAQNIHESKKEFHRKLQKACQIAFERTPSYMHKSIARSILIALHISIYLPLASFQEELKRAENDVITYICCFFNTKNIGYIQTVSSDFNRNWYQSKSNILQEFILKQMKYNAQENKNSQTLWLECANELGSLQLKVQSTPKRCSKYQKVQATHSISIPGIDCDGIIYDKIRDPPGQKSVYVIPGDPHQESYRLSTYLKYPPTSPANPSLLAKSGFYFTGYKDRVKCFCCGLSVENWTSSDDVMAPRWHTSDCLMMKKEECGNVPIGAWWNRIYTQRQGPTTNTQNGMSPPSEDTIRQAGNDHQRILGQTSQTRVQNPITVQLATITSPQHEYFLRNLDLRKEAQRAQSFISWLTDLRTVNANDLAQSGFFYLGNLDRVQCFSCGGVLRNWNYGDNVEAEHRRHFPHCRMVQGIDLQNVPLPPGERPTSTTTPSIFNEPPAQNETEQSNLRRIFQCQNPVSPHMRNEDSRFETFDHRWPKNQVRATPGQIAKAGFFFLGERDRVKCWYCNGGLQNWDPDDEPWSEHAKWFPTCEFILQCKGPDFVHRMVSLFPNLRRPILRGPFDVPPSQSNVRQRHPSPLPPLLDPRTETKRMANEHQSAMNSNIVTQAIEMGFFRDEISQIIKRKLENGAGIYTSFAALLEDLSQNSREISGVGEKPSEKVASHTVEINLPEDPLSLVQRVRELQDERKCKICLDNIADVVFVPCGHLCSCVDCAQALRKCPICRSKIEKSIRTYLS